MTLPARLVVLASGSGSNLQAILDAIGDGRLAATVELVVVNRPSAFAAERARGRGIPVAVHLLGSHVEQGRSRADYDRDLASIVAVASPDLVVLAGWMHVLSASFLDNIDVDVMNLHPALPGAFPGAHAIDDAIAAHERGEITETGVMVHLVPDEGIDDGPVLSSEAVPIKPGDSARSLAERIHVVEHRLLVETIAAHLAAG